MDNCQQHLEGQWQNADPLMREDDPLIATALAITALTSLDETAPDKCQLARRAELRHNRPMVDVWFYEAFQEEADELRSLLPAGISAEYTPATIQETGHAAPPAKLISIRTQSQIPLDWAPHLDGILTRSTGYDHLRAYAAAIGAPVGLGYLPLYCHRAVAEQAVLLWMALLRRLPAQMRQFRTFHRDGITGRECLQKTLVVVGVGHIGHEVCRLGTALGMRVLGVDVQAIHNDIAYIDIDDALPQADVLVCAMDLNASNRGYFDGTRWQHIKPGAVFVNVSRGELSPTTELLAALEAGQLSGVGLDVFDHEAVLAISLRSGTDSDDAEVAATLALAQRDDCILTPHNAFNTAEAVVRKSEHSVDQLVAWRKARAFLWPVPLE